MGGWKGQRPSLHVYQCKSSKIKFQPDPLGKYDLAASQLSRVFSCKRKKGLFVVVAMFRFDFKKCLSKFRKRKFSRCQVIIDSSGYSLLLSSAAGKSPLSRLATTTSGAGEQLAETFLDLPHFTKSMPK